ncbi:MAG: amidohydrolase [Symbiobacteriaceae bacterium]|nr:amidohydrolase [Symbiobacteriaceae bacterium]
MQESIDRRAQSLTELSLKIWGFAEAGFLEIESSKAQVAYLEQEGFHITKPMGGMPSAFMAEYGSGKPIVGYLGEFDALPRLSQKGVHIAKEPLEVGAPGHGCGHNLLGVGALGAALMVKDAIAAGTVQGTVRYYGCPAEELLAGKVFMARDGVFNDLDICFSWHPSSMNNVSTGSSSAMNSVKFNFFGRTAHAAGDPHNGRSALDAVELMNIATNYLREHVTTDVRIHYVISNGGGEPNIVPAEATVWYYVRAPKREQVEQVYQRVIACAEGAARMTDTTFEIEFISGCYNTKNNAPLEDMLYEKWQEVGAPVPTEEEKTFAKQLIESSNPEGHVATAARMKRMGIDITDKYTGDFIVPIQQNNRGVGGGGGSTDVGDVSHIVPTAQIGAATSAIGCPGHSWQITSCSASSFAQKAMLQAAKVLGLGGIEVLKNPALREAAWKTFNDEGTKYVSPLPEGLKPALDIVKH